MLHDGVRLPSFGARGAFGLLLLGGGGVSVGVLEGPCLQRLGSLAALDGLEARSLDVRRRQGAGGDAVAAPGKVSAHAGRGALELLPAVVAAEGAVTGGAAAEDQVVLLQELPLCLGVRGGNGSRGHGLALSVGSDRRAVCSGEGAQAGLGVALGLQLRRAGRLDVFRDVRASSHSVLAAGQVGAHARSGALELLVAEQALELQVAPGRAVGHDGEVLHDRVRVAPAPSELRGGFLIGGPGGNRRSELSGSCDGSQHLAVAVVAEFC